MKKIRIIGFVFISFALAMCGCGNRPETIDGESNTVSDSDVSETDLQMSDGDMFTGRDMKAEYDEDNATVINLSGNTAECSSNAVQISGGTITITDEGTYIISGMLNDGMIIVNAEDTDKLQLVLKNVSINSASSAAIYIKEADKVFITTASETENTLSNGGEYIAIDDNNIDSVIFSKSDLTLNGEGSLNVDASAGHGIVSKDDLVITGGSYNIISAGHGISANDSVRIADGSFTIISGKDGIQAENSDDDSLGFVYIENGYFEMTAEGDGISAGSYLQICDGEYYFVTGGGADTEEVAAEDVVSSKGLKATGNVLLYGGTFNINSFDDAIHSNSNVTINGGSYELATGDDGIHADANLSITDGKIIVTQSYEGLEGLTIDISGGEISIVASDDGLNAAGGNDESGFGGFRGDEFTAQSGVYINISGGVIYVDAYGDGIDSNGDLTISGGETYVSGPTNGANGALDYAGEAEISGGIIIAAGASGMEQNFGSSSTQGAMMVHVGSQEADTTISLADSEGNVILSWKSDKSYQSVVISCPDILQGEDYTFTAGTYSDTITMNELIYETGNNPGGFGGKMGGQKGNMEMPGDNGGKMGGKGGMKHPDGEMGQPDGITESSEDSESL